MCIYYSVTEYNPSQNVHHKLQWVSEQFLNGTSAHIRLFSALPWYRRFTKTGWIQSRLFSLQVAKNLFVQHVAGILCTFIWCSIRKRLQIPWGIHKTLYDKKTAAFIKIPFHAIKARRRLTCPIMRVSHLRYNKGECSQWKQRLQRYILRKPGKTGRGGSETDCSRAFQTLAKSPTLAVKVLCI